MLNKDNTVISLTAFNDPESLDKCLDSITKYNHKEFPIFVFLDNKDQINQGVGFVCNKYPISCINSSDEHLLPTRNKLRSLYYFSSNFSFDYIFSFEDDIELGPKYFDVMEDLLLSTNAEMVNSMNFRQPVDDPRKDKYAEVINHLWQFLIKTSALHKLQPLVNKYLSIFNEHTNETDKDTLNFLRETLCHANFTSHKVDFKTECLNNPTTGWDAALHWLLKSIGGFKYTTITPHCRPIPRDGYNYTTQKMKEGDKHLTQIRHNLQLPINWTLSTEIDKE